jgi:hypothetical protein
MKQFEVEFKSHDIIEVENFEEARKKFTEKHSIPDQATCFYDCETSEKKEVIGYCEMSELPIFEDDDYQYDKEGVMWLTREEESK